MVTKSKKASARKKKIKVLNLKKETIKDLTRNEGARVKGGLALSSVSGGIKLSGTSVAGTLGTQGYSWSGQA